MVHSAGPLLAIGFTGNIYLADTTSIPDFRFRCWRYFQNIKRHIDVPIQGGGHDLQKVGYPNLFKSLYRAYQTNKC